MLITQSHALIQCMSAIARKSLDARLLYHLVRILEQLWGDHSFYQI